MSQVTVLVGFAEALSAPEVVWSLADAGFEVCAFGRRGRRSALQHSRYVEVRDVTAPEVDAAATVSEVGAMLTSLYGTKGKHPVLLPLDDAAVWVCARAAEAKKDFKFALAGPTGRALGIALDKAVQMETARSAGFDVLPTRVARTREEVLQGDNRFPLILKPAHAVRFAERTLRKGRQWICGNKKELERAIRGWAEAYPLLVQPYVVGTGEGVFGLSRAGKVEALSGHRRLRMMNPHGSGSSACAAQFVSAQSAALAERFVQVSNWQGLFMIEMLKDPEGTSWFMEFNGRPWGSLALARRQGLEYPVWNVRLALDPGWPLLECPSLHPNLVCRHLGRELMHLLFVLKGPKSAALTGWPSASKSLWDLLDFGGAQAFYNWRRDDKRVFFADCLNTVRDNLIQKAR